MPTVTFGTGQRVTFAQMPSQKDIQDVATKLNIDTPNNPQTSGGIGQTLLKGAENVAKNIVRGPATMIARPLQLGQVGVGELRSKISGDPSYADNAWKDVNTQHGLIKPLSQETPESMVGEGLSTVALGAPGAGHLSIPLTGAVTGAMSAAGSSMQNNDSAGNVAVNTGIGGLLGYGTGALAQGITNHFNAPKTMEDFLSQSGVSDKLTAPKVANALRDLGINDLSSKEAVINAQNTFAREIAKANDYLTTNGSVDPISGQLTNAAQRWTSRLDMLKQLSGFLPGVGKYVNAITPNLLRHGLLGATSALTGAGLLTNTIPKAASYLKDKFIGNIPNLTN